MLNDPEQAFSSILLLDSLILGLTIGLFWAGVFVARSFGRTASYGLGALGLSRPKSGYLAAAKLGVTVGVGALIVSFAMLPLSTLVLERFGIPTNSTVQEPFMQGVQEWVGENPGTAIPLAILVVVLFAPAVEEIIFRGAVFGGLHKLAIFLLGRLRPRSKIEGKVSFVFAALLSSTAFALLHLEPILLPTLFTLAIALCVLYRMTGSLLAPYAAHATFNSFATLIIILSGLGVLPTQV